ncbi:uncharacterized protein EV154DRAFT_243145 [Mucor mucedo]|uniref:uncharacterized protein n=1 Tax=Mucor mucedo TaxID=29922 RepID=UPI0022200737|nr:uncharacterized protein EV154DRAFT_243145 [Mucor mucedo]KAI7890836.1 hypothetical protein EV154DRAFT_243145 [Mucor mucedo]
MVLIRRESNTEDYSSNTNKHGSTPTNTNGNGGQDNNYNSNTNPLPVAVNYPVVVGTNVNGYPIVGTGNSNNLPVVVGKDSSGQLIGTNGNVIPVTPVIPSNNGGGNTASNGNTASTGNSAGNGNTAGTVATGGNNSPVVANVPYNNNNVPYTNNGYSNTNTGYSNNSEIESGQHMPTKIIIIVSVIGAVAVLSAIGLFFFCKKRREKKKENMANAFFEFSVDKTSDKPSRVGPLKKKFQSNTPDSTI